MFWGRVAGMNFDPGLINYIDSKVKCRHLKILTCKWTLRQVFIRVIKRDTVSRQSYWYFRPSFVNICPPSPLPSLCEKVYCV